MEYWFEYAKRIRSTRDKAIVRAIYECERGIYTASSKISNLFYHLILTAFEYSIKNKSNLSITPLNELATMQHEEKPVVQQTLDS